MVMESNVLKITDLGFRNVSDLVSMNLENMSSLQKWPLLGAVSQCSTIKKESFHLFNDCLLRVLLQDLGNM